MNVKKAKAMRRIFFGETPYHSAREYVARVYKWSEDHQPLILQVLLKPGTAHQEYRRAKGVWNRDN